MLLSGVTKTVYLAAKANLTCPAEKLQPAAVRREIEGRSREEVADLPRRLSIRQISLLRTQMKTDLAIYRDPSGRD